MCVTVIFELEREREGDCWGGAAGSSSGSSRADGGGVVVQSRWAFGRAAAALEAAGEREAAPAPISPVRFQQVLSPRPRPPLLYGAFDHWSPPTPHGHGPTTSASSAPRGAYVAATLGVHVPYFS